MPLDPPVMTATLPSSFPMTSPLVCRTAPLTHLHKCAATQVECNVPSVVHLYAIQIPFGSSVELDQVLKDQLPPAISACLHKQSTFRKAAKFDGRETEIFRKRTNLRCCCVIVARQENDSPATMYRRILG